jgi:hypothetical protein
MQEIGRQLLYTNVPRAHPASYHIHRGKCDWRRFYAGPLQYRTAKKRGEMAYILLHLSVQ